ncbi:gamma-glutamyltransferase [Glaesserella parasuis]|nr:gamma-glutamyltransferase [Glaesserella parasuis]MCT8849420.1 gamma-glutamyltransferase [Glaesserella parasuis]
MPLPSSGGIHLVQILNMLENYPLNEFGSNSAKTIHHLAETMKLAYSDRSEYLGDPDFVKVPAKGLTSKEYAKSLIQGIDEEKARPASDKGWEDNWANIAIFFDYPADIRKAIYTTNAVESLNSVIRRVIKKRNVFPTDDSVFKVIWLAIKDASKKWTMPIQNWKLAMNRFMIDFGDRLDDHR